MAAQNESSEDRPLKPLREDLELIRGAPAFNGAPTWTIFDPVRRSFFQIGIDAFELICRWPAATVEGVKAAMKMQTGREPSDVEIAAVADFLSTNGLLQDSAPQAKALSGGGSVFRFLQKLIAWRVRLVRPERFLHATQAYVAFLFTRTYLVVTVLAGLLGLYLVSQQWTSFVGSFDVAFGWRGAAAVAVAVVGVKIIHELAHAYMAVRFGLRVPVIGALFIVFMPLLYTDVTDAWRLRERRKKILVDSAGVLAELSLASYATLLWSFVPDGPFRQVLFYIAAVSWLMSLILNLNPLMRFDGYFILSDWLGRPNLQPRAFALARWWIRETLFGLGHPAPEPVPATPRRLLILYAFACWLYRLVMFIGISLLIYSFVFKALGILLLAINVFAMIIRPVIPELLSWWKDRSTIVRRSRSYLALATTLGFLGVLIVPWSSTVKAPAVMCVQGRSMIFAPTAARITAIEVGSGDKVVAGDPLLRLASDELDHNLAQLERRLRVVRARIARSGSDRTDLSLRSVLLREEDALLGERKAYEALAAALVIRSPTNGTVRDLDDTLHLDQYVKPDHLLATVVATTGLEVRAFAREKDIDRVGLGASARFVPNNFELSSIPIRLALIGPAAVTDLPEPGLAAVNGGPIAVKQTPKGALVPSDALFKLKLSVESEERIPEQMTYGEIHVEGRAESIAGSMLRRILAVAIRESGA